MPNSLIYSPSFDGHRQVHVFVYAHFLIELGFKVFVAGNLKEKIIDSSYIDRLKKDQNATFIDTSAYSQHGLKITNYEFIELQKKYNIDLTVFAEADLHKYLFNGQIFNKVKRLRGKTIGIFFRPFYFYQKKSFIDKLRYIKNLPSNWKTDEFLFHEYFLKRFKILDSALYIDENFVSHHHYCRWLPDVFQKYVEMLVGTENIAQQSWIEKLDVFKKKNNGKFIFLFFGTAERRKGYDWLLKMAVEQDACFIHCGLDTQTEEYDFDTNELKKKLNEKGMLLETNEYISDPQCIEHFFKSVSHLVLPYRDFFGSSGIMLQALGYGIPVLVPDKGVMGYRVKKYKLGLTCDSNIISLMEQFKQFEQSPKEVFGNAILEYMKYQTPDQLKKVLVNVFTDSGQTITHP